MDVIHLCMVTEKWGRTLPKLNLCKYFQCAFSINPLYFPLWCHLLLDLPVVPVFKVRKALWMPTLPLQAGSEKEKPHTWSWCKVPNVQHSDFLEQNGCGKSVRNSTWVCGKYYLGLLPWPQSTRCLHSSFSSMCPNYTLVLQPTTMMLLQDVKDVCLPWGLICVRVPENTRSVWTILKVLSACHNQHLCSCSRLDLGTCHATSCA